MANTSQEAAVLGFVLFLIIAGLIVGFIARAIVPGPDPMTIGGTIVLGIVGSFVGGFLGYVLFGQDVSEGAIQPSGLLGSIIGAVLVLLLVRRFSGRGSRRLV
jgi:uncharacterized membrane protein YeaQ/YmgE (transglycosylase-associated protein family)